MNPFQTTALLTAVLSTAVLVGCSRETTTGRPPPTAQQDPSFGQGSLNTESRGLPQTKSDGTLSSEPGRTPPPEGSPPLPNPNP